MTIPDAGTRRALPSPIVSHRRLAAELRQLRDARRVSEETVATALGWSESKVSRYETAKTPPKPRELAKLLDYYRITGPQRDRLLSLADDAQQAGWWGPYAADLTPSTRQLVGLEHGATSIVIWQPEIVPALLQTGAYAREIAASHRHIEVLPPGVATRRTRVTSLRQHILGRESPPEVGVVLDEAALRRPAGDPQVMAEQLQQLAKPHPGITLRVLALATRRPVHVSPFTLLQFSDLPDVVALEHLTGAFFVEEEKEAFLYSLAFQALAGAALDPTASQAFIQELATCTAPRGEPGRNHAENTSGRGTGNEPI